jgi:hypothetical protein
MNRDPKVAQYLQICQPQKAEANTSPSGMGILRQMRMFAAAFGNTSRKGFLRAFGIPRAAQTIFAS